MKRKILFLLLFFAAFLAVAAFSWNRNDPARARKQAAWELLRRRVEQQYAGFKGTAGIVVEDLSTGWEISINRKQIFPAASLVKIPIMAGCYQAVAEGRLKLDEEIRLDPEEKTPGSGVLKAMPNGSVYTVEKLIELMIAESDNTATNILIARLTPDYLNSFFARCGLRATCLQRKMMDFSRRKQGVENYTSAADISLLLERMYRGRFISPKVSRKCMETLLRQKMKDRIPKKLPKDTPIAHKTGLERYVCHDAGVVFTPDGDFMVCVLTKSKCKGGYRAMKDFIARIALSVYNNYHPQSGG
ncbi:MAG: serine hydrolase [Deltaproteobacteria bacterium]